MSNYVKTTSVAKSAYSTLEDVNNFKCGGSNCSCKFKEPRTEFDMVKIISNCSFHNSNQMNSYDRNSFMYLGV